LKGPPAADGAASGKATPNGLCAAWPSEATRQSTAAAEKRQAARRTKAPLERIGGTFAGTPDITNRM